VTKERFCKIINEIQRANDLIDKSSALLREYNDIAATDFCSTFPFLHHENLVVELLEEVMSDKYNWVSYFIYELDFGRKYVPGCVTDGVGVDGGANIDISTAERLWEFLEKERMASE